MIKVEEKPNFNVPTLPKQFPTTPYVSKTSTVAYRQKNFQQSKSHTKMNPLKNLNSTNIYQISQVTSQQTKTTTRIVTRNRSQNYIDTTFSNTEIKTHTQTQTKKLEITQTQTKTQTQTTRHLTHIPTYDSHTMPLKHSLKISSASNLLKTTKNELMHNILKDTTNLVNKGQNHQRFSLSKHDKKRNSIEPNTKLKRTTLHENTDQSKVESPVIDPELLNQWSLNFDDLINHPQGLKFFSQFLKDIYAFENMEFYLEILDFENLKSTSTSSDLDTSVTETELSDPISDSCREDVTFYQRAYEKFCKIYENFIVESVINLDSNLISEFRALKKEFEKDQTAITLNCLEPQKIHVYKLMKSDCYPRFLKSENFKKLSNPVPSESSSTNNFSRDHSSFRSKNKTPPKKSAASIEDLTSVGNETNSIDSHKFIAVNSNLITRRERSQSNKNSEKSGGNLASVTFAKFKGRLSLSKGKLPGNNNHNSEHHTTEEVTSNENLKKSHNSTSYSSLRRLTGNFRSNKSSTGLKVDKKKEANDLKELKEKAAKLALQSQQNSLKNALQTATAAISPQISTQINDSVLQTSIHGVNMNLTKNSENYEIHVAQNHKLNNKFVNSRAGSRNSYSHTENNRNSNNNNNNNHQDHASFYEFDHSKRRASNIHVPNFVNEIESQNLRRRSLSHDNYGNGGMEVSNLGSKLQ